MNPDDGDRKHLWNVGKLLPDYTAQQPRRQPSSYSPQWEPEIADTIASEEYTTSIFNPEYGGSMFLRNVGVYLQVLHGVTTQNTNIDNKQNVLQQDGAPLKSVMSVKA
jgi:hypothetical protein